MADKARPVPALDPGALRVGYSGLPEDEEKQRLQQDDWKLPVEKVNYRGTEYWIPLEKSEKKPKRKSEKKPEKDKPKDN
jgi:hypothetical protein